jgi:phospholipid transport system substrate-binding protein
MKKFATLACCVLLLAGAVSRAAAVPAAPDEMVRTTTDEILASIKANRDSYAKDHNKLYQMAEEKVLPHFDFVRMSQWVLGVNWRSATPEQRGRFVAQFRDLLVRTYSTALLNYTDQELIYHDLKISPADDDVLVKTEVKQRGGAPNVPINYNFYKNKEGLWKVYDVSVDGISLVTNYRSVYAAKIKEQGMDALLASMADSAKEAGQGNRKSTWP